MPSVKQEKLKSLGKTLKGINKDFGKGAIMKMSDKPFHIPAIPSGSLALDNSLGIGGYPIGRVIELYGPESAGKTTMALEATAAVQKRGGIVYYIDAENALDPAYAQELGVNVNDLYISQPDTGEDALDLCERVAKSAAVDLIVVDSVAALVPKQEIKSGMGSSHVGLQARMMSQALRSLSGTLSKTHTTCIFINQLREKVGVLFGNPEVTPGGRALKFYASVRIRIGGGPKIKNGKQQIGRHTRVRLEKNKVAPPHNDCSIDIMYKTGLSHTGEVLDMAAAKDILKKSGAYYYYNGKNIGQGRENAKKALATDPDLFKKLSQDIRKAYHIPEPVMLNQDVKSSKHKKATK